MTIEHRTLMEVSDIIGLEYTCTHCQAKHLIPLKRFDRVIYQCPNCKEGLVSGSHIDSGKRSDDAALLEFVSALADLQKRSLGIRLEISALPSAHASGEKG